jgi:hypothetical protein
MSDITLLSAGKLMRAIPACDRRQYDALFESGTRLPRLALLVDRIAVAIARARRIHRQVALLVLSDIRAGWSTAPVNNQDVALMLQCRLRHDDTVACVGDSVVVVCNAIDDDNDAELIVRRVLEILNTICRVGVTFSGQQENAEHFLADALGHFS